jgi:hypothetical protein
MDTVSLGDLGEVTVGSTVHVRYTDDVRASSQRLEDDGCGGGTRAESQGVLCLLQCCNAVLEVVTVGVGTASVLVCPNGLTDSSLSICCRKRDLIVMLVDDTSYLIICESRHPRV